MHWVTRDCAGELRAFELAKNFHLSGARGQPPCKLGLPAIYKCVNERRGHQGPLIVGIFLALGTKPEADEGVFDVRIVRSPPVDRDRPRRGCPHESVSADQRYRGFDDLERDVDLGRDHVDFGFGKAVFSTGDHITGLAPR